MCFKFQSESEYIYIVDLLFQNILFKTKTSCDQLTMPNTANTRIRRYDITIPHYIVTPFDEYNSFILVRSFWQALRVALQVTNVYLSVDAYRFNYYYIPS